MIYGTAWKGEKTYDLVIEALEAGFTKFDTAAQPQHYREDQTGRGLRMGISKGYTKRSDLYIQTKFTSLSSQGNEEDLPYDPNSSITEQVRASIIGSLENLRPSQGTPLDEVYIDCLILHIPYEKMEDNLEAWAVFEECVPKTVRQLGISNVTVHELRAIYDRVEVKPTVVQNAFIPEGDYDREVRNFCAETGISYQAFWTLTANPGLLQSSPVNYLASEAGVDKEVALYELISSLSNVDVLNGTKRPDRMKSDLKQTACLGVWKRDEANIKIWKTILGQFVLSIGGEAVQHKG